MIAGTAPPPPPYPPPPPPPPPPGYPYTGYPPPPPPPPGYPYGYPYARYPPPPPPPPPPLPGVTVGRVIAAMFLTGLWFVFVAYIPYKIDEILSQHGFPPPVSPTFVLLVGTVLALLAGLRHLTKPTRLWGPARIASAGVVLGYLLVILAAPVFSVSIKFGSDVLGFALDYRAVLLVFIAVAILRILAGIVITAEDVAHPGERARIQFH